MICELVSEKRPKNGQKVPLGENGEDGLNWYAYVSNDPINKVDLWGLQASDRDASEVYHTWQGSFIEASVGYMAIPGQYGAFEMQGVSNVHFENLDTNMYFEAAYTFEVTDISGVAVSIGSTIELGVVTNQFPSSTTSEEVAKSYEGDFSVKNLNAPVGLFGISGSSITSESWEGFSFGGGIGAGGGYSEQVVDYDLIDQSLSPLKQKEYMNNWSNAAQEYIDYYQRAFGNITQ